MGNAYGLTPSASVNLASYKKNALLFFPSEPEGTTTYTFSHALTGICAASVSSYHTDLEYITATAKKKISIYFYNSEKSVDLTVTSNKIIEITNTMGTVYSYAWFVIASIPLNATLTETHTTVTS